MTSPKRVQMSKSVIGNVVFFAMLRGRKGFEMAQITLVLWRDIPAQIIAGAGRRGVKKPLPERFEQAIDRCAMKVGAKDSDAYLAEWRKAPAGEINGPDAEAAEAMLDRILSDYGPERLRALIDNDGWDQTPPA